jgi:hypothetical protein
VGSFVTLSLDGRFGIGTFRSIKRDFKTNQQVLLAFQESLEL